MKLLMTIQIGNSDDKLTQAEWARFVAGMRNILSHNLFQIHFFGGSPNWEIWQNACWVVEMPATLTVETKGLITKLRKEFKQDSVAVTCGDTHFV